MNAIQIWKAAHQDKKRVRIHGMDDTYDTNCYLSYFLTGLTDGELGDEHWEVVKDMVVIPLDVIWLQEADSGVVFPTAPNNGFMWSDLLNKRTKVIIEYEK